MLIPFYLFWFQKFYHFAKATVKFPQFGKFLLHRYDRFQIHLSLQVHMHPFIPILHTSGTQLFTGQMKSIGSCCLGNFCDIRRFHSTAHQYSWFTADIFHFKHVSRYLNQMPDKFASQKTVCFLTRCQNRIHTHSCCFFQQLQSGLRKRQKHDVM